MLRLHSEDRDVQDDQTRQVSEGHTCHKWWPLEGLPGVLRTLAVPQGLHSAVLVPADRFHLEASNKPKKQRKTIHETGSSLTPEESEPPAFHQCNYFSQLRDARFQGFILCIPQALAEIPCHLRLATSKPQTLIYSPVRPNNYRQNHGECALNVPRSNRRITGNEATHQNGKFHISQGMPIPVLSFTEQHRGHRTALRKGYDLGTWIFGQS